MTKNELKEELKDRRDTVVGLMDKCMDEVDSHEKAAEVFWAFYNFEASLVKRLDGSRFSGILNKSDIFNSD